MIAAGGRLDANTIVVETAQDAKGQLPEVRYFLPAGWAFAIWAPIILGEPPKRIRHVYEVLSHPNDAPKVEKEKYILGFYNRTITTV